MQLLEASPTHRPGFEFSTTVISIAILVSTTTTALAASVRTPKGPVKPDSYIIVLKSGENVEHHIEDIGRISARSPGSKFLPTYRYEILNGYSAHATGATLTHILSCPEVDYIEADDITSICDDLHEANEGGATEFNDVPAEMRDDQPGHLDGFGVDIFSLDTGIKIDAPYFEGNAFLGTPFGYPNSWDDNGHGTAIAARVVGNGFGMATAANIVAVKVFNFQGTGFATDLIAGIIWASVQFQLNGRHSILLVACNFYLNSAVDAAVSAVISLGLHVVVAAGDHAEDAVMWSPASVVQAITIGAIDCSNKMAWFSNHGFLVDAFAPGVEIACPSIHSPDPWATTFHTGTGMSAAYVTGQLAIALGHKPNPVSPTELSAALTGHAVGDVTEQPEGTTKLRTQLWWQW
ncbi:peptidase S8/S53 domain-containing protein [Cantharellus anzutake]|uniref:peptidase S8/S53 domain-containing protein n=1 Tax=Cantharellus anzutake TaxID=1750568 RepID=UPI001907A457|nr:peptidase S8/S53 domain-containing protein [Cantharellus anzutake]KAF8335388.1 peptidase S8/S53 domain-containing protein [Cantharellus anzutake]